MPPKLPESRPSALDFPSPDAYHMSPMTDDLVPPVDHAGLDRNQQVRVLIEQRMGWDPAEEEQRLEAAKQVMDTVDTLLQGHTWSLSDIGPGQYAGEGRWLRMSQDHPSTSFDPHAPGTPPHSGYTVKQKEIDLYVRQYEDSRRYAVHPHGASRTDQPLEIIVDKQGLVQAMTRRPNVQWGTDNQPEWVPTAASRGQIEAVNKLLQPDAEKGQSLRYFDPEREVMETHPDYPSEVRIYKRNLIGLLGRAANGIKDLIGRI